MELYCESWPFNAVRVSSRRASMRLNSSRARAAASTISLCSDTLSSEQPCAHVSKSAPNFAKRLLERLLRRDLRFRGEVELVTGFLKPLACGVPCVDSSLVRGDGSHDRSRSRRNGTRRRRVSSCRPARASAPDSISSKTDGMPARSAASLACTAERRSSSARAAASDLACAACSSSATARARSFAACPAASDARRVAAESCCRNRSSCLPSWYAGRSEMPEISASTALASRPSAASWSNASSVSVIWRW